MKLKALVISLSIIGSASGMVLHYQDPKAQECAQRVDCVVRLIAQGATRNESPLVHYLEEWYASDPGCAAICLHPDIFKSIFNLKLPFNWKRNALWLHAKSLRTLLVSCPHGVMTQLFMERYLASLTDLFFKNMKMREQILGTLKLFQGEEFQAWHATIYRILAYIMAQKKHVWVQQNMKKLADCAALFKN